MISLYSVISLSFVPLFAWIMIRLKRNVPHLYCRLKIKFSFLFSIIMIIILARLFLYFDVKSLNLLYSMVTMTTVLPFYSSEILMALFLCYVLYFINRSDSHQAKDIYGESFMAAGGISTPHA